MRRPRTLILLALAVAALLAFYVYTSRAVRVETIAFESRLVGKTLAYEVVLPRWYSLVTSRKMYPVLYLLHGWGNRPQGWLAETKLTEYAARHELILVLPEGGNNWYTDSATDRADRYETYISEELIADVENRFRAIKDRGARGVAGFSMGGYGAIKFGLKHPDAFAFAGSMSGAFDAPERTDDSSIMQTFGEAGSPARAQNDLFKLAAGVNDERLKALPYFYMDCGTEDHWLKTNRDLDRVLSERQIAHEYRERAGGHDWKYWDRQVQDVLQVAAQKLLPAQ